MKKIFLLIIGLGLFTSCEEFLDVTPRDVIVEETAYQSLEDIESGAIGVYASLSGGNLIDIASRMGDNVQLGGENRGQGRQTHDYQVVSTSGEALGVWTNLYDGVSRLNRVLANIDRLIESGEVTVEETNAIRGEMLAIRAMQHFDLWRTYADRYNPSALAVPWLSLQDLDGNGRLDGLDPDIKPVRQSTEFIFARINEDLQNARTLLEGSENDIYRFTQTAVIALQARVALYQEDYPNAATYSSAVLERVELATREEFPLVWTDDSNAGEIFSLRRQAGDGAVGTLFTDLNGDRFFQPAEGFVELFDQDDDVRFDVYVSGSFADDDITVSKYPGIPGNIGTNDIKIFRAAEMQLILAEAQARQDQVTEATATLNILRTNRIEGFIASELPDVPAVLAAIETERRRELAFEGHRWYDLKRTNTDLVRDPRDCTSGAIPCSVPASDYRWLLPIPQAEIFANENITQNPGYTDQE